MYIQYVPLLYTKQRLLQSCFFLIVIGFRLGAYRDGDLTVAPPTSCIVPEETKRIVEVFIVSHFVAVTMVTNDN